MSVFDYSSTPENNLSVGGVDVSEGCSPAGINDAIRQIMADVRDFSEVISFRALADFVAADLSALSNGSVIGVAGRSWVKVTGATDFEKNDWEPVEFDTVEGLTLSRRTGLPVGTLVEAGGYTYQVESAALAVPHITNAAGVKFTVQGDEYSIEAFNPNPTDAAPAINLMMQLSASTGKKARCTGAFNIQGTITPNGPYHCEWVNCRLTWTGSDVTTLTEVLHNPEGTTVAEGSGVHVLFDTKGCEAAVNLGKLEVWGSQIGNAKRTSIDAIPDNLAGVTCSEGFSPEMQWGALIIRGCHYGWYQGDQRGTGALILPYTRWVVQYLELRFNRVALQVGRSGNSLDETTIVNLHLTRNRDNGRILTIFNGDDAFFKGTWFTQDSESYTATTIADDTTVTFNTPHALAEGDVVSINGASQNLNASATLPHTSRVESVPDEFSVVLESAPLVSGTGLAVLYSPPSLFLENADMVYDHVYFEKQQDVCCGIFNGGSLRAESIKISEGDFGCRENTPVLFVGAIRMSCCLGLNNRTGATNNSLRHLVGVPAILSGPNRNTALIDAHVYARGESRSSFEAFSLFGVYRPETDIQGSFSIGVGTPSMETQTLVAYYAGQEVRHEAGPLGRAQETITLTSYDTFTFGSNLRGAEDLTGVTKSGVDLTISGGVATKVAGAECFLWEDLAEPVSAGDRLRIEYDATIDTQGVTFQLFNGGGGGTPAGNVTVSGSPIRKTASHFTYIDAAANTDRIGVRFDDVSEAEIRKIVVQKEQRV